MSRNAPKFEQTIQAPVLYNLTVRKPTAISSALVAQLQDDSDVQYLILARGSWVEVFLPDPDTSNIVLIASQNMFAIIRCMEAIRVADSGADYLLVTSDAGTIAALAYDASSKLLKSALTEIFGKTGVRRTVPGEYLAVDPRGRAAMVASIEKHKFAYIFNRDNQGCLTISSPLESNAQHVICYALIGIDVGYENPCFAAIEANYEDEDANAKFLVFYELDFGLNTLFRRVVRPIESSSNMLLGVPRGENGSSGVLVCADNLITYIDVNTEKTIEVPIPRARTVAPQTSYIVCGTAYKLQSSFFLLLQNQQGHLLKMTMALGCSQNTDGGLCPAVGTVSLQYFGTAVLSTDLVLFREGFLFAAAEVGDAILYQINDLGDSNNVEVFTSSEGEPLADAVFDLQELENITPVDTLTSCAPSLVSQFLQDKASPKLLVGCGREASATLRLIEFGLEVTEHVTSQLPSAPIHICTTRLTSTDRQDKYIFISLATETCILEIGTTVVEVQNTQFIRDTFTLKVQQMGPDSVVQVHRKGVRHIAYDDKVTDWVPPDGLSVEYCSSNVKQLILALSNHELVYFEADETGMLIEFQKRLPVSEQITAIAVGSVPQGLIRCPLLAVCCKDESLRIFSLDIGTTLDPLAIQAMSAPASSVCMTPGIDNSQYLHIGLSNGVYVTVVLDTLSGEILSSETRLLGTQSVRVEPILSVNDDLPCVLGLSTRPWLGYHDDRAHQMIPLAYKRLNAASAFSSGEIPRGVICSSGKNLHIFSVDRKRSPSSQKKLEMSAAPSRFEKTNLSPYYYVASTDATQSRVEVVDLRGNSSSVVNTVHFENNTSIRALTTCRFASQSKEYLVVSTVHNLQLRVGCQPKWSSAALILYDYVGSPFGSGLHLVHSTKLAEPSSAIVPFQGMLLVGCGKNLILYDVGTSQLLRKYVKHLSYVTDISCLNVHDDRIIIGDVKRSVSFAVYDKETSEIIPFAFDPVPRSVLRLVVLDVDTVALSDKFANVILLRCPPHVSSIVAEPDRRALLMSKVSVLNACPYKLDLVAQIYIGDLITGINKGFLFAGGLETLVYTGIQGTIGILAPIHSKQECLFLQKLETEMQDKSPSYLGRSFAGYRGYYAPARNVIDGDLCEQYQYLDEELKQEVASTISMDKKSISRRIAEFRARCAF